MRLTKYRGMRPDSRKWIYGFLFQEGIYSFILHPDHFRSPECACEVLTETAGQFLVKIKKNDTEIYEGDIIRHGESVRFIEVRNGNTYATRNNKETSILLSFCQNPVKLGNIYDNPELLEAQDE